MVKAAARRDPAFERAFVAFRYFLGARGGEVAAALEAPSAAAGELAAALEHPDRQRRAEILAGEIGQVGRALEARSYR